MLDEYKLELKELKEYIAKKEAEIKSFKENELSRLILAGVITFAIMSRLDGYNWRQIILRSMAYIMVLFFVGLAVVSVADRRKKRDEMGVETKKKYNNPAEQELSEKEYEEKIYNARIKRNRAINKALSPIKSKLSETSSDDSS